MLQPSFWDNRETADKLVGELKDIKNIITNVNVLSNSVNSALEMIDDSDDDVRLLLEEEINELKEDNGKCVFVDIKCDMIRCRSLACTSYHISEFLFSIFYLIKKDISLIQCNCLKTLKGTNLCLQIIIY